MHHTIIIDKPIQTVFDQISTVSAREEWMMNVSSIQYDNPSKENEPASHFQLIAVEGNIRKTLKGVNKDVVSPNVFSFEITDQTYSMFFSYKLTGHGEQTYVEQVFEVEYYKPFMNFIEKLFKGSTKQTAQLLLDGLKSYIDG